MAVGCMVSRACDGCEPLGGNTHCTNAIAIRPEHQIGVLIFDCIFGFLAFVSTRTAHDMTVKRWHRTIPMFFQVPNLVPLDFHHSNRRQAARLGVSIEMRADSDVFSHILGEQTLSPSQSCDSL